MSTKLSFDLFMLTSVVLQLSERFQLFKGYLINVEVLKVLLGSLIKGKSTKRNKENENKS